MAENLRVPDLNKVILVGRITRDLELRYTAGNQAVVSFSVAASRSYKDAKTGEWKEDVSFIPVVAWSFTAERLAEKAKKGTAVSVEGKLQSRSWETQQGEKRTTLEVNADRVQLLTVAAKSGENNAVNAGTPVSQKQADNAWDDDISSDETDEDIPF
jgi:single-strand DNA-binding protein